MKSFDLREMRVSSSSSPLFTSTSSSFTYVAADGGMRTKDKKIERQNKSDVNAFGLVGG
jgi:hypothetical protein